MKPKVIFMGTPEFAVPILKVLIETTDVLLVVTQPDRFVGRKQELLYSPVKKLALENNIEVFQPEKLRNETSRIFEYDVDLIVTCAYGQILPLEVLNHPKIASINVHASLLPKLRGGAPIHHAIIDGYDETGITIMYMAEGMDDGDIITQAKTKIEAADNVGTLHDRLSIMGADLLKETLPSIINKTNNRVKQKEDEVTFAYSIKREDEHIDFTKDGKSIINKIRGLNPWPTANTVINGNELKVLDAIFEEKKVNKPKEVILTKNQMGVTCSDGIIYFNLIKPFGKKVMSSKDFINGIHEDVSNWSVE